MSKMLHPEQIALIKTSPNWCLASRKSAIQELFEERGHFFLLGAACHCEFGLKEHGWLRLKTDVKPFVDGTIATLQRLIGEALPKIGQRERILDCARSRRVMEAYRQLALRGETVTTRSVELWDREHPKHRDVHIGELAALFEAAGLFVPIKDAKVLRKMKSQQEMKTFETSWHAKMKKKWHHIKKKSHNKTYKSPDISRMNKVRKDKYITRVLANTSVRTKPYIRNNKKRL